MPVTGLPQIETIAIGDELLTGKIADTNSAFVASRFFDQGFPLDRVTVVADDFFKMEKAILEASTRADFVVVFGGLGPTSDDKTAECVARLLKSDLVEDAPSKKRLYEIFEKRGRVVNEHSLKQVLYPAGTKVLPNTTGLAPGFLATFGEARFFFLPGVPLEMKAMFDLFVMPEFQANLKSTSRIYTRTWKCLGIGESDLQKAMTPIESRLQDGEWLGYRTRFPENLLSLYLKGGAHPPKRFDVIAEEIRAALKTWTYTEENRELEEIVIDRLLRSGKKIVLAESCTGGLVAQRLTRISGASEVVWGGFTTYRLEAKEAMLGVKVDSEDAAVSETCSRLLCENAKRVSGCDVAAAVTGYVGPAGGTSENPVGTIFIAVLGKRLHQKRIVLPSRERSECQWGAATWVLREILAVLE